MDKMSSKLILGYFDFRGVGEPIRLLLRYVNADFEDKRYSSTFANGQRQSEWFDVKYSLGFDFPNLPYLIDGDDVKLTQSLAILRYLGRKYSLDGDTEEEKNRIALLEYQVQDLRIEFIRFFFQPTKPTEQEALEFRANCTTQLGQIEQFLGERVFVTGERMSYVDFWLYEYLHRFVANETVRDVLAQFGRLVSYMRRFEVIPQLADYLVKINA